MPFWARPLTLNFKGFFSGLAEATKYALASDWTKAATGALSAIAEVDIRRTQPQLAGVLLERSMVRAVYALLRDYLRDFSNDLKADSDHVCRNLEDEISRAEIPLDRAFLERPAEIALVPVFQDKLEAWLSYREVGPHHPQAIAARLPHYFVWALNREFQDPAVDYGPLVTAINTPVAEAWRKARTWEAYRSGFRKQLAEPVFGEAFGLPQIFLWPRGYYEVREKDENDELQRTRIEQPEAEHVRDREGQRFVVDVKDALDHWMEQTAAGDHRHRTDAIRLLSGDPGSGKSSFVRMYADYRMERGDRVLVVPLHRLNVTGELGAELETFCSEHDDCPNGLLDAATAERQLLLVLDGLDELSKQGSIGATIAASFVDEVVRKVNNRNAQSLRVRVIISGRPIAVQNVADKFRSPGQVLHLLPYFVSPQDADRKIGDRPYYIGRKELLADDLRHGWWKMYGRWTGRDYAGLPQELTRDELDDLTTQPLLNYLIALVYRQEQATDPEEQRIDFSGAINRNQIYDVLLDQVYDRDWDPAKIHKAVEGMQKEDFRDLLEEMALTAWHGSERTTTVQALRRQCENTYLADVLSKYERHSDEGVGSLFTAFYFRKSDRVEGPEPTFEFTHKSFGEYLTARRIVDAVSEIHGQLERKERHRVANFTTRDALVQWLRVCGPTEISLDLMAYVRNEIPLRQSDQTDLNGWQQTILTMLNSALAEGMPCEQLGGGLTFQELSRRARNAEEALLVLHSACAAATGEVGTVKWPQPSSAGELIHRVRGQRLGPENCAGLHSLDFIDLTQQQLFVVDLHAANLHRSLLSGAGLDRANLDRANLGGANLGGANLGGARLKGANLDGAILDGTNLVEANLEGARLEGAILSGAILDGANLVEANLEGARLDRARLEGANLEGANLEGANLDGASLKGASLDGASLKGANLDGASLKKARLSKQQANSMPGQWKGKPAWLDD